MAKRRNPVVRHAAILRKGGPHRRSDTGIRHRNKRELNKQVEQYFDRQKEIDPGAESDCPDQPALPTTLFLHAA